MNWLNQLDDVLDKALTPQNSRHGGSSSALRGQQQSALTEHLADQFGNESESSHESSSPVILPSRSLEIAGPSIPGRARRRSEGAAILPPGNQSKPAQSKRPHPAIPGQLKRNSSTEIPDKQQKQYPGNIKRRITAKKQAEEAQQSSDSEVEVMPAEIDNRPLENKPLASKIYNDFNRIETVISGESSVVVIDTVHDEKQKEHAEKMQQVVESELGQNVLHADASRPPDSKTKIVQSIGSLAKTKAWGVLPGNRNDQKDVEHDAHNTEASSVEASKQTIDEKSDRLQIGNAVTSDTDELNQVTELNSNRGESRGIVVTLFSDDKDEARLRPSHDDSNEHPDAKNIHEVYNLSRDNNENLVEESIACIPEASEPTPVMPLGDSDFKYFGQTSKETCSTLMKPESSLRILSILDDATPPVKNSGRQETPAAAAAIHTKPTDEDTFPASKVVDSAHKLTTKLGEQATKETETVESSERLLPLNGGSSASIRDYANQGHVKTSELLSQRKDQDNFSGAGGLITDPPSTVKVPAVRNGSLTASVRGRDSPHRSASLRKSDVDADSTISIWSNFKLEIPFDRSRNCYGMVNLRLLRARRLSCSTGSFVQGSVSLKPWKGKVRTKTTRTFSGSNGGHGVCAMWDDSDENQVSMVHAFSSAESPIPTIEIDLTVSPLGMGLLGFSMGTVSLSCEELLMNPYRACRYWLTIPDHNTISGTAHLSSPMLQVEAMFEPTTVEDEIAEDDQISPPETIDIPKEALTFQSANSGGNEEYLSTPQRVGHKCGTSTPLSDKSPPFSSKSQRSMHSQTNQHLLRLKKFRLPATCCVCKKSIMSGIRAQPAYRCEKCKIDCCDDCILQVDIKMPCGSLVAQDVTKNSIQNKLSLNSILNTVAPVHGNVTSPRQDNLLPSPSTSFSASKGVGIVDLVFLRAFVLDEPWSPESDAADILADEKTSFKAGDYYMRITRVGSKDSARTQTVQNSSKPVFDSNELVLDV